ncbi:MAG TPA: hypothetical protein VK421_13045 [Pyrinomonadaceae bacterium]|nr:hypothetical protein [Pyrinomonadaceae bacterium]
MLLLLFHGEGILFSSVAHLVFGAVAGFALVLGLLRVKSRAVVYLAAAYLLPTLLVGVLLKNEGWTQTAAILLSFPWNMVVPCYNLDASCPVSRSVLLICAGLNAALLVHLGNWLARRREGV